MKYFDLTAKVIQPENIASQKYQVNLWIKSGYSYYVKELVSVYGHVP